MIRNVNNISFKSIYALQSLGTVKGDDLFKLGPVFRMGDQFPHNDIFVGVNSKKQMYIEVHKKDLTPEILTKEVLDASPYTTEQMINIAQTIFDLKTAYKFIHPESIYRTITQKTISQMSMFDMVVAIRDAVFKLNDRPENRPN